MSPMELAREYKAAHLRQQDDYDRDVRLAWHVVYIDTKTQTDKRMPMLNTLLAGYTPKVLTRADHHAQQLGVFRDISARYGLTLRTKES